MENQYLINLPNGMTVLATTHVVITWRPSDKTSSIKLARNDRHNHVYRAPAIQLYFDKVTTEAVVRHPSYMREEVVLVHGTDVAGYVVLVHGTTLVDDQNCM
jgi:hypothetical protein